MRDYIKHVIIHACTFEGYTHASVVPSLSVNQIADDYPSTIFFLDHDEAEKFYLDPATAHVFTVGDTVNICGVEFVIDSFHLNVNEDPFAALTEKNAYERMDR